jgi:glycerol 2-dehydrogenase (NADP+)
MTSLDFTLNNGKTIPAIGLGTWKSTTEEVAGAVECALTEGGYRHIDTAFNYRNEDAVGLGIKRAMEKGVKREDIFVTTKIWVTYHDRVEENLDMSLERLGLDYVDMLLIHWPVPLNPKGNDPVYPLRPDGSRDIDESGSQPKTWKQMEAVLKTGKTKSIGVSNFSIPYLEELLKEAEVVPAVNQVELHPLLPQLELMEFCKKNNIVMTAFSPFGSVGGPLLKNELVVSLADKYNTSPGGILTSYHIGNGTVVIPKSVTNSRIVENGKSAVTLSQEDLKALNDLHKTEGIHRTSKPKWGVDLGFPDFDFC